MYGKSYNIILLIKQNNNLILSYRKLHDDSYNSIIKGLEDANYNLMNELREIDYGLKI